MVTDYQDRHEAELQADIWQRSVPILENRWNRNLIQLLGSGAQGFVYETSDPNLVVKITESVVEAFNSIGVWRTGLHKMKGVVTIEDIVKVERVYPEGIVEFYAILREEVLPFDQAQTGVKGERPAGHIYTFAELFDETYEFMLQLYNEAANAYARDLDRTAPGEQADPDLRNLLVHRINEVARERYPIVMPDWFFHDAGKEADFPFVEIARFLMAALKEQIVVWDVWPQNMGFRQRDYKGKPADRFHAVLFDLGLGTAGRTWKPFERIQLSGFDSLVDTIRLR